MATQDQSCPGIDVLSRPEVVVWSGLRLGRHVNVDIISWSRVNQKAYQWRCFVTIQCPVDGSLACGSVTREVLGFWASILFSVGYYTWCYPCHAKEG